MSPTLPPELVLACLAQLDPHDPTTLDTLLSASLASHTLNELAHSSILWRPLLKLHYSRRRRRRTQTLDDDDDDDDDDTRAYDSFVLRSKSDSRAKDLVSKLQHPLSRLPIIHQLRTNPQLGSNVVQILERHRVWASQSKEPEIWLSLQYWAEESRKTILRDEAITTWNEIAERDSIGMENEDDFERGVNAFGAFRGFDPQLLEERYYDLALHPRLVQLTTTTPDQPQERLRWIAEQVCEYMLSIGIKPATGGTFHDLNNHYVESVFSASALVEGINNGTLPMTLVSIFCSFVRRLPNCRDVEVRPIGFPGTVLAGLRIRGGGGDDDWVYVNPFSARARLPTRSALRAMLVAMGTNEDPSFFRPASAKEMCVRVGRNILTSIQTAQLSSQSVGISCLYSVAHSLYAFMSHRPSPHNDVGLPNYIEWLTSIIQAEYPFDVEFLKRNLIPSLSSTTSLESEVSRQQRLLRIERISSLVEAIEQQDVDGIANAADKKWVGARIKWKIGHVFRHRLFGYHAVVRGWDDHCQASETWIMQMQVDRLPFGREQPFYHVIVADGSSRYVAQENITFDPVPDRVIEALLEDPTIGKYFRKTEGGTGVGGIEGEGEEGREQRWRFVKSFETEYEYPDS